MKGIISIQSHVVYGHAGNSSAVFPLQRMGFETWPIHTVQFSNHTQYAQGWKGRAFEAAHLRELVEGMDAIDRLEDCLAVVTGYQGGADQCGAVMDIVKSVKNRNPKALYVCDPVMGAPDKGCIVAPGVAERLIREVMPMADVIVPNQFELSSFVDMPIENLQDAAKACKKAMKKGPQIVLVKHLHSVSQNEFTMMLATPEGIHMVQRPHVVFEKEPVGVGDLISALFTAGLLKKMTPLESFEHCNAVVYGVLLETAAREEWEIQTVAAQDEIVSPTHRFSAVPVEKN